MARALAQAGVDFFQRRVARAQRLLSQLVERRVDRVEGCADLPSPASGKQPRLSGDEPGDLCVR